MIDDFTGQWACLSNSFPCKVLSSTGEEFPSAEHAYQACKYEDPAKREWVRTAPTAKEAVRRGNRFSPRPGFWRNRERWMRAVLAKKFDPKVNPDLVEALLATGDQVIEFKNRDGQTLWGLSRKSKNSPWVGYNLLGQILMDLRKALRAR